LRFGGGAVVMRVDGFWNATPFNQVGIKNLEGLAASFSGNPIENGERTYIGNLFFCEFFGSVNFVCSISAH
jgi:hypothetical protein